MSSNSGTFPACVDFSVCAICMVQLIRKASVTAPSLRLEKQIGQFREGKADKVCTTD